MVNPDPYDSPEERKEGCFVSVIANMILATFGLSDPDGFCSTYREWHIFLAGAWAGLRAKQFGDIPDCPEYWKDEQQYYSGGAIVFNVLKIQGTMIAACTGGLVLYATNSGNLTLFANAVLKIMAGII